MMIGKGAPRVARGAAAAVLLVACGGEAPRDDGGSRDMTGNGAAGQAGSGAGSGGSPAEPEPSADPETASLPGQALFLGREVLEVRLTIDSTSLRELDEHGNREEYMPASVRLERAGMPVAELGQVGVRHKGAYSLHHCWDNFDGERSHEAECAKLSLKLKFDEYDPGARFDGLKRLNLHASMGDASKLRELIAYQTFRDFGVDGPRAIPALVIINDEVRGLFIAVEEIDGRYTAAHHPEGPNGNLYKEVWPNVHTSDQDFAAALETNEEKMVVTDMRAFAEAVSRSTSATLTAELEPFVSIESLLRYIAVDRALRNWDGIMAFYSPTSPHNFFWYRDDGPEPRFHLIPWDLDNTLWAFDPYMGPEQWVTAAPIPNFNAQPRDCQPRAVWEPMSTTRVTPPRCDRLLDVLAESSWSRLVAIGHELSAGPLAPARLAELAHVWAPVLEPLVAADPTLDAYAWQQGVAAFRDLIARAAPEFEGFLAEGLIDEPAPGTSEAPSPADLLTPTVDSGLHVGGVTNFEFATPPAAAQPAGVFTYGDPLATFAAGWSTGSPISGTADLRFDFTFNRGPGTYDEWTGIGLACGETDVTQHSSIVVWLSADVARSVRVRLLSSAYDDLFGGVSSEFGTDHAVGPVPTAIVIDFADLYYPDWAKGQWTSGQGFPGTDAEASMLVRQRFGGLIFAPSATFDAQGELSVASEAGFLRIDNIYFL
jgi:spore coat protein H